MIVKRENGYGLFDVRKTGAFRNNFSWSWHNMKTTCQLLSCSNNICFHA